MLPTLMLYIRRPKINKCIRHEYMNAFSENNNNDNNINEHCQ